MSPSRRRSTATDTANSQSSATAFAAFIRLAPMCVLTYALIEHAFASPELDALFERHRHRQYTRDVLFSTLVRLMLLVAFRDVRSVHAAYKRLRDLKPQDLAVSVTAVYDKLAGIELPVCRALVQSVTARLQQVAAQFEPVRPSPVPGLNLELLDGNYLAGTEHRIEELRRVAGSAQPGMGVWLYDDATGMFIDCWLDEDGHTNERKLFPEVLAGLQADRLYLADRNFCTVEFLDGIDAAHSSYLIRLHGSLPYEELSPLRLIQRAGTTGTIRWQRVRVQSLGRQVECRMIEITRSTPTQSGETIVRLLTNVDPLRSGGSTWELAELYLSRWHIENGFRHVTQDLRGEVETLGYPGAALFCWCLAICAANVLAVLKMALVTAHRDPQLAEELSGFALADEVQSVEIGLRIAVPESAPSWRELREKSSEEFAAWLIQVCIGINPARYLKSKRGPKRKPPPRRKSPAGHVATSRELAKTRRRKTP